MKTKFNNRGSDQNRTIIKYLSFFILPLVVALVTSLLLFLFLSGQIIEIPNETADDGFIRVLGVTIILITMINVALFALIILKKIDEKFCG